MENKEEKFRHMMLEHDLYPSIKGPVFELMNKAYNLGQSDFIKLIEALECIVDYLDANPTHKIQPNTPLHMLAKEALTKAKLK